MTKKNFRVRYIDFFKGMAILNMIIYHALYDMRYVFDFESARFFSISSFHYYQQYICISFIFLSGMSAALSRNSFKNGVKLLLINLLFEIITPLISKDLSIIFGVLALIGTGLVFLYFMDKKIKQGYLAFFIMNMSLFLILKSNLNTVIWQNLNFLSKFKYGYIFGFIDKNFYSADYFPIFPWIFLLFSGYFLNKYLRLKKEYTADAKFDFFYKIPLISFISSLSRYSLIIYLLHQPVLMSVFYIYNIIRT